MSTKGKFSECFNQHTECAIKAAHALKELVDGLPNTEMHARSVQSSEKEADRITYDTIEPLHKIFTTPFDRDEIHKLIVTMDDIFDLMEGVSLTISLHDVTNVTDEARQLATVCVACHEEVRRTMVLLSDMSNGRQTLIITREIGRLESDVDRVMRTATAKLFRTENDIKLLIKLKAIYEQLESITGRREGVASIIEGIVLENA